MANVIISNIESPKYSENLYPYESTLNGDVTITHNARGVAELDTSIKYNRLNSIRAIITDTSQSFVFNIGDANRFIAPNTGNYIFSFRLYMSSAYSTNSLIGRFTNFQNSAENQFDFSNEDDFFEYDKWNTYAQIVYLEAGDFIENEFKLITDTIGTRVHIGGLKVELDDRGIGFPSRYSEPYSKIDASVVLDFGSIAANSSETLTVSVVGSKLNDVVCLGHPVITDTYAFDAYISDVNEVSIKCYNYSAVSVNPASGTFKIKILK